MVTHSGVFLRPPWRISRIFVCAGCDLMALFGRKGPWGRRNCARFACRARRLGFKMLVMRKNQLGYGMLGGCRTVKSAASAMVESGDYPAGAGRDFLASYLLTNSFLSFRAPSKLPIC